MATVAFDILKLALRLEKAGATPEFARETAEALAEAISSQDHTSLATKADLAELKADLIKWVVTVVVAMGVLQSTLITALILRLVP